MKYLRPLILSLPVIFILTACGPFLTESLPAALAGKDLNGRLKVLDDACAEHARRHLGRRDPATGQFKLPQLCRALSERIGQASRVKPDAARQPDLAMLQRRPECAL